MHYWQVAWKFSLQESLDLIFTSPEGKHLGSNPYKSRRTSPARLFMGSSEIFASHKREKNKSRGNTRQLPSKPKSTARWGSWKHLLRAAAAGRQEQRPLLVREAHAWCRDQGAAGIKCL